MLYPNYRLAAEKAVEVLEDCEITQAPIELKHIFEALSNEIRLLTYHDYMHESGRNLEETISDFDSKLGVCAFEPSTNRFLIYHNSGLSDEICHFTLAHLLFCWYSKFKEVLIDEVAFRVMQTTAERF